MRAAGCDVFPEQDAWNYLKGMVVKHPVSGKHLQSCMGLLSTAYVFSWSRWNAGRGAREIVLQLKEIHGNVAKEVLNIYFRKKLFFFFFIKSLALKYFLLCFTEIKRYNSRNTFSSLSCELFRS